MWASKQQTRFGIVVILLLILFHTSLSAQDAKAEAWVDSVFRSLTPQERLGQLIMIRAHSDLGPEHIDQVKQQIKEYGVGSLCFFQGTPAKQLKLTNEYQSLSKVPLMIAMDAEWGLGMRFKEDGFSYPRQLTLGAIQDNRLIFEMGRDIGRQMKRIGVHINFAPVVDININPLNPVINDRSFGEDRYNVTAKSYMYMRGMQQEGVIACAKHFPGHGDTDVDSHHDLPVINHSRSRLDSIELYPFKALTARGIQSIMVAHLSIPTIDPTPNLPTTLSPRTIHGIIREDLQFEGLVFTDAMEMKGVTKYYPQGEVEAKALVAGNDILVLPQNIEASFNYIHQYVQSHKLKQKDLDQKVKKVLHAKYRLGLTRAPQLNDRNLHADLFSPYSETLKARIYEKASTLLINKSSLIPLRHIDLMNIASVSIGVSKPTSFQNRLNDFVPCDQIVTKKGMTTEEQIELIERVSNHDVVFVSIHDMSKYAQKNFGIHNSSIEFVRQLSKETRVIVVLFGSPYSAKYFEGVPAGLICAYQDESVVQDIVAQQVVGVIPFNGRLPVTASAAFPFNKGITTQSLMRLGYARPEQVGLKSDSLEQMASIVNEMIGGRAAPGCQILVAKDGRIVYERAFGHQEYNSKNKITTEHIYDLASITKVAATTLAIMKLQSEHKLDVEDRLDKYLPELRSTNKGGITIEQTMAHHGGFIGWIPFYKETIIGSYRSPRPDPELYRNVQSGPFNIPVADNLYLKENYQDTIWRKIYDSELRSTRSYRYSDLGFYLLSKVVESVSGQSLDQYCETNFYKPLHLTSMGFNPYEDNRIENIVPTENDTYFRRQKIQGYVHDMGAAMLGGISGHAGLFSNAKDLGVLMQMLLNEGFYGGTQYIETDILSSFTTRYVYSSRRGIGFDMKELDASRNPNTPSKASILLYGHTGFTGTCAWVDPMQNLIFIFLSNRTFPNMNNNKLYKDNYRIRLHEQVYQALM